MRDDLRICMKYAFLFKEEICKAVNIDLKEKSDVEIRKDPDFKHVLLNLDMLSKKMYTECGVSDKVNRKIKEAREKEHILPSVLDIIEADGILYNEFI